MLWTWLRVKNDYHWSKKKKYGFTSYQVNLSPKTTLQVIQNVLVSLYYMENERKGNCLIPVCLVKSLPVDWYLFRKRQEIHLTQLILKNDPVTHNRVYSGIVLLTKVNEIVTFHWCWRGCGRRGRRLWQPVQRSTLLPLFRLGNDHLGLQSILL